MDECRTCPHCGAYPAMYWHRKCVRCFVSLDDPPTPPWWFRMFDDESQAKAMNWWRAKSKTWREECEKQTTPT